MTYLELGIIASLLLVVVGIFFCIGMVVGYKICLGDLDAEKHHSYLGDNRD